MRKSLISLAALAVATTAAPAMAQDAPITISGEAAVVSDYRFRGVSLSDEDFAIQGSVSASHESGLYAGIWGSSLASAVGYGGTEIDLYGGFATDLTEGVSLDVGLTYYTYPDAPPGDFDYLELYGSLGTTIGPVDASVGVAYAPEMDSLADESGVYVWTDAGVGIPDTPVSLTGHVGYVKSDFLSPDGDDYFDWSVGASVSYDALTLGVAYVDTDLGDYPNVDAGVVFSLSAGF